MSGPVRTYHGADAAAGSLLFLRGARGVAFGERVRIRSADRELRGEVVDASEETTVIQVLDDSLGLAPGAADVEFTGEVATAVVGRELLGRSLSGSGRPLDDLPEPVGEARLPLLGAPLNPSRRRPPASFIETGISAIDGLNTLVRGQKLPIFSGPGLPALELSADIVDWARAPGVEFAVIFVGLGITARETELFLRRFQRSGVLGHSVLYLNQARDPPVERLLAPRLALTQAEHLAFELGYHVLVVMADIASYAEALRELAAAREEVPGRRGYPGYMYTDLARIFERAGIVEDRPGSVTQVPVVTMPDDDMTHPVPDLTGYITEGQIVLGRELHRAGTAPPIDVLPSLSRLMNAAIGEGRTVPEHRAWANQLYASYARGREGRLTAAIVGEAGLSDGDRRALRFSERFEERFIRQDGRRELAETMERGWSVLRTLPREDLHRLSDATLDRLDVEKTPERDARPAGVDSA